MIQINTMNQIQRCAKLKKIPSRLSRSKSGAVFLLDKHLETPVVVIREQDDVEVIGPPDEISNLRPILRKKLLKESPLQARLRNLQDATQDWNQTFWTDHNKRFVKEKTNYVQIALRDLEKSQLTADEMSSFYKRYLDDNWRTHLAYNKEWYKRNSIILILAMAVGVEKNVAVLANRVKGLFNL